LDWNADSAYTTTAGGMRGARYPDCCGLGSDRMQQHTKTTTASTSAPTTDASAIAKSCELPSSVLDGDGTGDGGGVEGLGGDGIGGGDGSGDGGEGGATGDAAATLDVSDSTGTPSVDAALDASGKVDAILAFND
jgi:hypothetical protein